VALFKGFARAEPPPAAARDFSLREVARTNPGLAELFTWGTNSAPPATSPMLLHVGCGERVLDGFVNLDFIPHDGRVHAWNLLDLWPEAWTDVADGLFSEDTLEHFFHGEQVYILCNANRALRDGAVARTLMPSLPRLVEYGGEGYAPRPDELMHQYFGVDTGADALNMGMRFSGHRWLHGPDSLAQMAAICGFDTVPTTCAESTFDKFNGINLRSESDSLSFANDLRKVRRIARTIVEPATVTGARLVEEAAPGVRLYVATAPRPTVGYALAQPVAADAFACLNIRSSNLSSFREHNQKWLVLDDVRRHDPWYFDETLKSRPCMNLVTRNQLRLLARDAAKFARLTFSPAATAGEYFTVGCAEIYTLANGA
jgi:hypothetical protein